METTSSINSSAKVIVHETEGIPSILLYLNYGTAITALFIFIAGSYVICIMSQCTKIPTQVKRLSMSYILSDAIGALFFFAYQSFILIVNSMVSDLVYNLRTVSVGMMLSISWFSIGALSFDRVIALKTNLLYATLIKRTTIDIVICVIWLFHFIAIPSILFYGFDEVCDMKFNDCNDWESTKIVRFFITILLVIIYFTLFGSNAYILTIARIHERQIADIKNCTVNCKRISPDNLISERQFSATKAVLTITLTFILLNLPIIINLILLETNIESRNDITRRAFHAFAYFCIQLNSIVNMLLYAGKFKEFKFRMYIWLGRVFYSFTYKADELRMDVYNIVVSNEQWNKQGNNNTRKTSVEPDNIL